MLEFLRQKAKHNRRKLVSLMGAFALVSSPAQAVDMSPDHSESVNLGTSGIFGWDNNVSKIALYKQRNQFITLYKAATIDAPEKGAILALQEFIGFKGRDLDDKIGPITRNGASKKADELGIQINTDYVTTRNIVDIAHLLENEHINGVDVNRAFFNLAFQESGRVQFRKGRPITSHKGALGISQIMPATGPEAARLAGLEWNSHSFKNDIQYNYQSGLAYFKKQLNTFGTLEKALAAYNAGPGNVRKYGGIPPFRETRRYVKNITTAYNNGEGQNWRYELPAILTQQKVQTVITFAFVDKSPIEEKDELRLASANSAGITAKFSPATAFYNASDTAYVGNITGRRNYAHSFTPPTLAIR